MASNDFINECKNNAYKNRLGTISIKDTTKKSGSVITTDEAIEGPLNDYKIFGNTYQKTTDGKNLIPNNKISRTNQGVTFTPQEDGTYLINGQNTTNSNAIVYIYQGDFNLQAGTYYGIPTGDNNVTVTMYARFSDNTRQYIDLKEINNINKQIIYADIYIQVRKKTSTIFNDYKVYPMLSAMPITIDDYEPYTNGASPNPDYPQEIISCGDRTKNLFDKNTTDVFSAYFESSGDTIEYAVNNRIIYLKCKSNTVYTLTQGTSKLSSHIFQIATTDEEPALGVKVYNFVELWSSKNYTYTTNSTAKYILIRIRSGDYIDEFLSTIQVEEGNTATEYEPYGYKIPINVRSENLFDKDNDIQLGKTATFTGEEDNEFTVSSNSSRTVAIVKVPSNEYVSIAINNDVYKGTRFFISYLKAKTTEAGKNENRWFVNSTTILTPNNTNYIGLVLEVKKNGTNQTPTQELINDIEMVITTGSTVPNKYIPYYNETTNIYLDEPLRKIDGYSDYIDFINGKVVRQLGETILNGSEAWNKNSSSDLSQGYCEFELNYSEKISQTKGMYCDKFQYSNSYKNSKEYIRDRNNDIKIRVNILISRLNDATTNEFKTWLSSNNVTVDYVLSTPTEEDIELSNINLIEGKNIITIGTELESIIEIEYTNWENKIKNSDKLQNITIDNGCIVNNEIIGSVYSKKITSNILDSNELELENKRINTQIGVKYDDDSIEMINMGECTVERPKDEQTANTGQIIAYDDLNSKLEEKYVCGIDYQQGTKTLKDLYIDLCSQLGLTPKNLDFDNNTIPIVDNPFTNGEKNRVVLQTIEKVSGTFSDIDNDTNEIDLCWLSNSVEPDYTFYRNDYTTLEGGKIVYGPINCLIIKNSQIDDENVTIKDDESIALNGEHSLIISEDYILHNAELRQLAINAIWNKVHNLTYVDCKLTTLYGKPFLKLGNKIRVYKTDTEYFDTYVLLHQFTYDGSFESIIQSPALTEQEIKTKQKISLREALKNTEVEVNKQKQTITALVQETSENTEKTSQLQLQSDEINQKIEDSQYYIDENGNKKTISGSINELKSTAEEFNLNLQKIGGLNLMKNSSGQNGTIGYKSRMLKPYVEFQTWDEFNNYISLGSKVYQIYTCFIHVVGETTDSERDCWYGLYYTEGFSKSYYFEQVVRNGNFIYPDKYNKYMDILYDNLFMFVEQNYTNSSSFKTFLEKYTDEYTNITPNIFTSISNDIIENNTISKSAFLLTPTVRDMYTTMNEDKIYGESFTMPKNTNKLYFSVKSKIDGLCGRARLTMYQLNDKMENIQNNLNVYDSYENHIANISFINIPDNILNEDNFIEYKVEMEISDRCVEILPCFSIGNNFVNDGPYVNFINPILNPITRFYWKKVWETIDEVSAYYTYRSTHIKKKLQFFESTTLPEISDTPDFTQLWLCTNEIEGYIKDRLYTPQYELDSNGEIISKTWVQTDYTKEQIERGIEIIMFDNWTYVYSAGAVESATPRPDMKFIIADCMVSATDTSWQPASGENYWGKNIKISGDKGIYIYNTIDGYNRIIDEKQDIAKDKNGNTTWELTGKGMKTKRAECESIRLPKLEILCTNDSTAFYYKENEDDDYGA